MRGIGTMNESVVLNLKELEKSATKAPWRMHRAPKGDWVDFWIDVDPNPQGPDDEIFVCEKLNMRYYTQRGDGGNGWSRNPMELDEANMDLIAAMRNALPELLAERAAMRARIAELEAQNKKERGYINRCDNLVLEVQKRNKELEAVMEYLERQGVPADVGGNPTPLERLTWLVENRQMLKRRAMEAAIGETKTG
jgi:hypothetical protein